MAKKAAAPAGKPPTKTEIYANIAEATDLSKKEVQAVFDALNEEIKKAMSKKGPGVFNIPNLCKITKVHKPARKAYKGIDPFTKEEKMFKAKPASTSVKMRPLKGLKDLLP